MTSPVDQVLQTTDGRVWIAMSPVDLVDALRGNPTPTVVIRLLTALKMYDESLARQYAQIFGVAI